ncbi:LL-diaminopimelate aminotransferase, partial [Frankliniella fusca]
LNLPSHSRTTAASSDLPWNEPPPVSVSLPDIEMDPNVLNPCTRLEAPHHYVQNVDIGDMAKVYQPADDFGKSLSPSTCRSFSPERRLLSPPPLSSTSQGLTKHTAQSQNQNQTSLPSIVPILSTAPEASTLIPTHREIEISSKSRKFLCQLQAFSVYSGN